MINAVTRLFAGAQSSTTRIAGWKHVFVSAFLSFAVAAPHAFASCGGKNLEHGNPTVPSAVRSQALPILPIGPGGFFGDAPIVGLWNVTFTSGGQVVDVAFDVWHSDQTEVLNDYTPPAEGNVCLGVWELAASNTYKLKHPSWSFDANGNLLGTVVIGETVKLSADANSYSGTYTYDIYDTSGDFLEEFTGTIHATRIRAN